MIYHINDDYVIMVGSFVYTIYIINLCENSLTIIVKPLFRCLHILGTLPSWVVNKMSHWMAPKVGGRICVGLFLASFIHEYDGGFWKCAVKCGCYKTIAFSSF